MPISDGSPLAYPVSDRSRPFHEYLRDAMRQRVRPHRPRSLIHFSYQFTGGVRMVSSPAHPPSFKRHFKFVQLSFNSQFLGLPFHSHGAVANAVVRGAKLWMLYPPGYRNASTGVAPTRAWREAAALAEGGASAG